MCENQQQNGCISIPIVNAVVDAGEGIEAVPIDPAIGTQSSWTGTIVVGAGQTDKAQEGTWDRQLHDVVSGK